MILQVAERSGATQGLPFPAGATRPTLRPMRVGVWLAAGLLAVGVTLLVVSNGMDTSVTTSDRNVVRFWSETFLVLGSSLGAAVALTWALWLAHARGHRHRE